MRRLPSRRTCWNFDSYFRDGKSYDIPSFCLRRLGPSSIYWFAIEKRVGYDDSAIMWHVLLMTHLLTRGTPFKRSVPRFCFLLSHD